VQDPLTETDCYKLLGLGREATSRMITRRYHAKALQHHPDKGGLAENFKKIQRAYEILIDPDKRRAYDETGTVDDDQYDEGEIQPYNIVFPPATREEFEGTAYAFDGDDAVEYSQEELDNASDGEYSQDEELDNASDGEYSQDDGELDSDEKEETDEKQVRTPPAPAARAKETASASGTLRRYSVPIGLPGPRARGDVCKPPCHARSLPRAGPPLLTHRPHARHPATVLCTHRSAWPSGTWRRQQTAARRGPPA
jgi:curved DNA-binding protein CbpA